MRGNYFNLFARDIAELSWNYAMFIVSESAIPLTAIEFQTVPQSHFSETIKYPLYCWKWMIRSLHAIVISQVETVVSVLEAKVASRKLEIGMREQEKLTTAGAISSSVREERSREESAEEARSWSTSLSIELHTKLQT